MIGLLVAVLGAFVFYSRSKYFPKEFSGLHKRFPTWIGYLLLILTQVIYCLEMGVAVGLLTASLAVATAYCLLVFVLSLPKKYAWISVSFFVFFLIIDLCLRIQNT